MLTQFLYKGGLIRCGGGLKMNFCKRKCSLGEEGGNIAIFTAIGLPTLLLLVFGGIQLSNVMSVKRVAQEAIDAATIAATLERGRGATNSEAEAAGNAAFAANIRTASDDLDAAILPSYTFVIDGDDVEVETSYRSAVDFPFNGLLGLPHHTISIGSTGFVSVPRDEVTLVLDISNSMAGAQLVAMQGAATSFIQSIGPFAPASGTYRTVNLVPFANRVNLGAENIDILAPETADFPDSLYEGCVRREPDDEQADDSAANYNNLLPYEQVLKLPQNVSHCPPEASRVLLGSVDEAELIDRINNLELAWATGTDHALSWGWRTLSPDWRGRLDMPFGLPRNYTDRNQKVLILLTDGRVAPIDYLTDTAGNEFFDWRGQAESLAAFTQVCEAIEDQGHITVYTVGFELDSQAAHVRNALIDCATDDGQYFDASVSGIVGVFDAIASGINTARLTR